MNKLNIYTLCVWLCFTWQLGGAQTPEYDIAIGIPDTNGLTYFEKGDFVRVGGNQYMTNLNINYNDLKEWFWGAKIINKGYKDILPSAHPRLRMKIDCTDDWGNTTYNIYTDTIIAGITDTIKAGDSSGTVLISYFRDINFIWANPIGRYDITYWVEQDSIDGFVANDTVKHSLGISHTSNCGPPAYSSKARRSTIDGKVEGTTIFFPNDTTYHSVEHGSVFYFPSNWFDLILDSVEFRYYIPSGFSGDTTQYLLVNIYQYDDGSSGGSGFIHDSELTQVGLGLATLTGLGTTIPNGSSAVKKIDVFWDAGTGGTMMSLLDGFYYITVATCPSLFGGLKTFGINDVPIVMSDEINYAMNLGMTSSSAPILPSVFVIRDSSGKHPIYIYNHDKVPSLGIYTSYCYSNIDKIIETEANFTLYPNPTNHLLTIEPKFQEPTDIQYIITDMTGRVFYLNYAKNGENQTHIVDVKDLPAGVYLVNLKTDDGVSTEKFVKN